MIIIRANGSKQHLINGHLRPYRWYHALFDRLRVWSRSRAWRRRQREFGRTQTRYYGDGGTIHSSGHVDVELGTDGRVCAVWFRCQMIPFEQRIVDQARSTTMNEVYAKERIGLLCGVEIKDK